MDTARTVENNLTDLMRELFAAVKAHDIQRDGKPKRGFRKVTLSGRSGRSQTTSSSFSGKNIPISNNISQNPHWNKKQPSEASGEPITGIVEPNNFSPKAVQSQFRPSEASGFPDIPPFRKPANPKRLIAVDLETYYPWADTPADSKRRKEGKAHKLAKDSLRCSIRLLTINDGAQTRTFDLLAGPALDDVRDLLRNSSLIVHNADFDVTVLRRHRFELSSFVFDTLIASQLLSLGKTHAKADSEDDDDDSAEDDSADNRLEPTIKRYLGVILDKGDLGNSDWSVQPLSEAHYRVGRSERVLR